MIKNKLEFNNAIIGANIFQFTGSNFKPIQNQNGGKNFHRMICFHGYLWHALETNKNYYELKD